MNTPTEDKDAKEAIYHVNSYRVPCVGVAPMQCLQVRRGDSPTEEWQFFYSQIRGFDYQPGYLYRLRVLETPLPPEQVPADASSIRYDLIEVLEKTPDPRLAIHDTWALVELGRAEAADLASESPGKRPYVEFNVTRREYLGEAGCGSFSGEILTIGEGEIRLGPATVESEEPCPGGGLRARWPDALEQAATWRRDGLFLELADTHGATLLRLRKID
jgi:hypothetical protein